MRVLVTGANGFVGRHVVETLIRAGHEVVGTVRRETSAGGNLLFVPEGASHEKLLRAGDVLVHTAGLAHQPSAKAEDHLRINRDWTIRLAEEAAAAGVVTVIHLSSIAAREAEKRSGSAYGASKFAAEPAIENLARRGILGVNLRPPVIYGPSAPGNWAKLLRLADSPWPLPFAAVRNRRSYLGVAHLTDAILAILAVSGPDLSGTYEIADRERVSLAEVIAAIRSARRRPTRLFPWPPAMLEQPLRLLGKKALADGLFADLAVDAGPFMTKFGWNPARSTLEAMRVSVS